MKEDRSKSPMPNNSSVGNEPNGNISMVHFLQNQETSSGSFSSSLYSDVEISLHLIRTQKLQLLRKTAFWLA